jgi:hypothetical protein
MVLYEKVQKMKWVTHWEASDPSAGLGEAGDTVTIDNQAPYRVTCGLALPGRHAPYYIRMRCRWFQGQTLDHL